MSATLCTQMMRAVRAAGCRRPKVEDACVSLQERHSRKSSLKNDSDCTTYDGRKSRVLLEVLAKARTVRRSAPRTVWSRQGNHVTMVQSRRIQLRRRSNCKRLMDNELCVKIKCNLLLHSHECTMRSRSYSILKPCWATV